MHDLIIIGGGPGGGYAAGKAKKAGLDTLLIEKRYLGGVCLNEGCIPSKTLLNSAKIYSHARHGQVFGVNVRDISFDLKQAVARKDKVIAGIRRGTESVKKKMGIPVVFAEAQILPSDKDGFNVKAGDQVYKGRRLLICTGSEAIRPPIPGADQAFVLTNREMLALETIPKNLVIIGGGVIGLEFATFFSEIGSAVTVVEMLPAIAGSLDNDIRTVLEQELTKKGIVIKTGAKVTAVGDHTVTYETAEGAREMAPADVVLLSTGRRPVIKGFGLENLNVMVERGAIKTDERMRTNVPNVWAAGDVNGILMLAHTASREADVAIADMTGRHARMRYETIPSVIYTHPEAASVGYTKEQAEKAGYEVAEKTMMMSYNGRYLAENEAGRGICKAVVDRKLGTVLGFHMIGGECSEMIAAAGVMIEAELRVQDVEDIVFAHPTVAEMIKDTICEVKL